MSGHGVEAVPEAAGASSSLEDALRDIFMRTTPGASGEPVNGATSFDLVVTIVHTKSKEESGVPNLHDGQVIAFSEEAFTVRFRTLWLGCADPETGAPYSPRAAASTLRSMGYAVSASTLQMMLSGRRANPRLSTLVACSALLGEPLDRFAVYGCVSRRP